MSAVLLRVCDLDTIRDDLRTLALENLFSWEHDGVAVAPERIGPRYARTLARLRSLHTPLLLLLRNLLLCNSYYLLLLPKMLLIH